MVLTIDKYHNVYGGSAISYQDQIVLKKGLQKLIEMGKKRQGSEITGLIEESDIQDVFRVLGGGKDYRLADGRTVLEWWKDGSLSGVKQSKSFELRLGEFNNRIEFLRSGKSAKAFIAHYYRTAFTRFWKAGLEQSDAFYSLFKNYRDKAKLSCYLSISDIELMMRVFGFQLSLSSFISP